MNLSNIIQTFRTIGLQSTIIFLCISLSNCGGTDPEPLEADFTWNPSYVGTGQTVVFSNSSTGNPTEFSWSFEGGSPETSDQESPSVEFPDPGTYEVTLTVSNGKASATTSKMVIVICTQNFCKDIDAKFTASNAFPKPDEEVQFTDQSIGVPTTWEWTFEGGTPAISTVQNPVVTYAQPGFYKVTLKSSKEGSNDTEIKENFITVGCNGAFCNPLFSSSIKTSDVVYGIDVDQHLMNVFEPTGDESTSRPLVILFGGGAFNGSNLTLLEPVAQKLTNYGFVVAAARYRNGPSNEGTQNFIRGNQDVSAAVRYFRKEAEQWGINPNSIYVGGNGTGAFLALNHSYLDANELSGDLLSLVNSMGGLEGAQGNDGYSSEASGCISLAGGIYSTLNIIKSDDVPLFAVHGTADSEVPIGTTPSNPPLHGAIPVTDKTKSVGLLTYLYKVEGGGHDAPRSSPNLYIKQLITWQHLVMNEQ